MLLIYPDSQFCDIARLGASPEGWCTAGSNKQTGVVQEEKPGWLHWLAFRGRCRGGAEELGTLKETLAVEPSQLNQAVTFSGYHGRYQNVWNFKSLQLESPDVHYLSLLVSEAITCLDMRAYKWPAFKLNDYLSRTRP